MSLGAVAAGLAAGPIMEKIGRKKTLAVVSSGLFLSGNLFLLLAPAAAFLLVGRFLIGLGVGVQLSVVTVYILEIATMDMKGVLGCFVQGMATVGIIYMFSLSFVCDWKTLAAASAVFSVPFTICMWLVPESPRWLLKRGRQFSAMRSFEWLRGKTDVDAIEREMDATKQDIEREKRQRFSIAILSEFWRPFLIALTLMTLLNLTGFNVIVFYAANLFHMLETNIAPNTATLIIGIELFVSCALAIVAVARVSRRFMLIASVLSMSACELVLGFCCYELERFRETQSNLSANDTDYGPELLSMKRDDLQVKPGYLNWLPAVAIFAYVFLGNVGFGTLSWVVTTELLPPKVRGVANSFIMCVFFSCGFIVAKTFVDLFNAVNLSGTFLIYAGFCAFAVLFTHVFVPETKDKDDAEIQRMANRGFGRCLKDAFLPCAKREN